jgi:uncharacterized membrane protein
MSDQNPPEDGTPEEGAAPPPPPPGYGVPPEQPPTAGGGYPPPPPGDAYGAANPYAGGPDYNPTDAIGWGWTKFKANVGPLLITALAVIGIQVLFSLLQRSADASADTFGVGFYQFTAVGGLLQIVGWIVSTLIAAGLVRACLAVADGESFDLAKVFSVDKIAAILVAAVVTGILTVVGLVLCILPGLVVIYLMQFVNYFIIDKDQTAMDAIKSSYNFVTSNLGPTLLYSLLAFAVVILGAIACGVGLFVALPVAALGHAYTYRKLNGQPVSA